MIAYNCGCSRDKLSSPTPGRAEAQVNPARGNSSALWKMENRGNEANKYMKTKEVTVFVAANSGCFARRLARIGRKMEYVQRILLKTNLRSEWKAEAWQGQFVG